MATLLFHKELNKENTKYIIGCLALAGEKRNTILSEFSKENWEEELKKEWEWTQKENNISFWSDTFTSTEENLISGMNIIKNLVLDKSSLKGDLPKFINYTVSDIKKELFNKTQQEPTPLQLQIATTLILMEISSYFGDNSEELFDFPLYEAYIKKHNLSSLEYEVFDMIEDISSAVMILV